MKHVSLDKEQQPIRDFVSALSADAEGSILEIHGEPVARLLPVVPEQVDLAQLKAAILKRRDAARELNEDWQTVDAEIYNRKPGATIH